MSIMYIQSYIHILQVYIYIHNIYIYISYTLESYEPVTQPQVVSFTSSTLQRSSQAWRAKVPIAATMTSAVVVAMIVTAVRVAPIALLALLARDLRPCGELAG